MGVARAHNHRGDGGMVIERMAIAELTPQTVLTMNGLGRKVVGAIKGHQELITKDTKMRQHAVLLKSLKDLDKHRLQIARRDRIIQYTHAVYCKERTTVRDEIKQRQDALTKREPPKPRTTSDDDEE